MDRFNLGVATAVGILAKGDLFAQELSVKLDEFGPEEREEILAHCLRRGFLDEGRTAQAFVRKHQGKRGPEWIRSTLSSRGAPDDVIELALSELDSNPELVLARKFPVGTSPAKAARFLASRGFSEEVIADVLENVQKTD